MMVETAPVAALEVAKAKLLLEVLVIALDPPARLGELDQALERAALGQVGEPVLGGFGVPLRPLDQQPLLRPGLGALCVAVGWTHPHGREARGQFTPGSCAPGDRAPVLRRQAERQRLERHRLVRRIAPQPGRAPASARPWGGSSGPVPGAQTVVPERTPST